MPQIDKVLVFDIWGDYAHFKRIETTTSPLTYLIPTGTSLTGLIAAIVGLEKDSYYELLSPENFKFAIRIMEPLKKIGININLIKTDDGFYLWDNIMRGGEPHSPTPFEFVKRPKYRIYLWLNQQNEKSRDVYNKLKAYLKKHQSFYTPYLGISELIANFKFVGEFPAKGPRKVEEKEIHSVVRKEKAKLIVEKEKRYGKDRIPIFMDKSRITQEYDDVFYEINGKMMKISTNELYRIGEENVVFL